MSLNIGNVWHIISEERYLNIINFDELPISKSKIGFSLLCKVIF